MTEWRSSHFSVAGCVRDNTAKVITKMSAPKLPTSLAEVILEDAGDKTRTTAFGALWKESPVVLVFLRR